MTEKLPFDAEAMVGIRRVSACVPAPSGTWLVASAQRLDKDGAKYVSDLWKVALDQEGDAVQLTRGAHNDTAPAFRADGTLAFMSNRNPRDGDPEEGDKERNQIWVLPASGGEPTPLTDEPLGVSAFKFARQSDKLVVVSSVLPDVPHDEQRKVASTRKKHGPSAIQYGEMPVRYWDHWLPEAAPHFIAYSDNGEHRVDLTPTADREYRYASWDLSPDGRWLAVTRSQQCGTDRIHDSVLVLIDTEDGSVRELAAIARQSFDNPKFSPDGLHIACVHHVRRDGQLGRPDLVVLDVETGVQHTLTNSWDYIPQLHGWTEDGNALLITADMDAQVPIFSVHATSGELTRLNSEDSSGTHSSIAALPGRGMVVGIRHRWCHPPEPFRVAMAPSSTPELLASISGFDPATAEEIADFSMFEVAGAHGDVVQTYLMTPRAGTAPHPLLLWIHGGPVGQFSDQWHWRWNALVAAARGYAVALPNPRGSTGRGQAFIEGIWNNAWGAECYQDLMAVTDHLESQPDIDGNRMVAMGGSFGGYMTNWIGTQTDRFSCLVTHASVYHFSMFYGVTDYPAWWAFEKGLYPHEDLERFEKYSPHKFIDQWKTPTFIIHGERDYRVPIGEALALFESLQYQGVESELLVFPDENHWIMKPKNIQAWYERFLAFCDRYVN